MNSKTSEIINRLIRQVSLMNVKDYLQEVEKQEKEIIKEDDTFSVFGGLINLLIMNKNIKNLLAEKIFREGIDSDNYYKEIIDILGIDKIITIFGGENLKSLKSIDRNGHLSQLLLCMLEKDANLVFNYCLGNKPFYKMLKIESRKWNTQFDKLNYRLILEFLKFDRTFVIKFFHLSREDYQRLLEDSRVSDRDKKDLIIACKEKNNIKDILSEFFINNASASRVLALLSKEELTNLINLGVLIPPKINLNVDLSSTHLETLLEIDNDKKNGLAKKIIAHAKRGDAYTFFRKLLNISGNLESLLDIYGDGNLEEFLDDDFNIVYILLASMTDKNVNVVLNYALNHAEFYHLYFKVSKSFSQLLTGIDYNLIKKYLKKNLGYTLSYFKLSKADTIRLINDSSIEEGCLIEIIRKSPHKDVLEDFFSHDYRAIEIFKKLSKVDVVELLNKGVLLPRNIVDSKEFFDYLKASSFIKFRNNINRITLDYGNTDIEKKVFDYYREILGEYDPNTGNFISFDQMFESMQKGYFDANIINKDDLIHNHVIFQNIKTEEDLNHLTNHIVSNLFIDYLFKDNYYNVKINITEMIRYNSTLKKSLLDPSMLKFYRTIATIDDIDIPTKIEMFYKLADKRIDEMYYHDYNRLRQASYQEVGNSLLRLNENTKKSDSLTDRYGVDIYDYRKKKYYLFVRTLNEPIKDITNNEIDSYSLISNENSNIFTTKDQSYVYGYDYFPNEQVFHVFENDAFSSSRKDGKTTAFINRIMSPREIVTSSGMYSEIQIKNKSVNHHYAPLKPSYIIAVNEITPNAISESKRLNLPIILINEIILNKGKLESVVDERYTYAYDSEDEMIRARERK